MSSMSDMVASYKLFKLWDGSLVNLEFINSKIGGFRIKDSYFFSWGAFSVCLFFLEYLIIFFQLNLVRTHSCGPWVHCIHELHGTWIAKTAERDFVSLVFFPLCRYDFVEVEDPSDGTVLGRWCGSGTVPGKQISKGNQIRIRFVSDEYFPSEPGFCIHYNVVMPVSTTYSFSYIIRSVTCLITLLVLNRRIRKTEKLFL